MSNIGFEPAMRCMPTRPRRLTAMGRRLTMTCRPRQPALEPVHRTTIAISNACPILMCNTARPAPITGPRMDLEATILHHTWVHTGLSITVMPICMSVRPYGCTVRRGTAVVVVLPRLALALAPLLVFLHRDLKVLALECRQVQCIEKWKRCYIG